MENGIAIVCATLRPSITQVLIAQSMAYIDHGNGHIKNPYPLNSILSDEYIRVGVELIKGLAR